MFFMFASNWFTRRSRHKYTPNISKKRILRSQKKRKRGGDQITLLKINQALGRSLLSLVKNQLPINIVIFSELELLKEAVGRDL